MKSSKADLQKRGYVDDVYVKSFAETKPEKLCQLLTSDVAMARTASATIIGQQKLHDYIPMLCGALKVEKALYSKIAISESLSNMGEPAIMPLIELLGIIGNNQHKALPTKAFNKKSYPLPRDIAARTLVKIGEPALTQIETIFEQGKPHQILEAVDVFGHICFNSKKTFSSEALLNCYKKQIKNDVMVWKILRAFSAFKQDGITAILKDVANNSKVKQHRWEASRSLALLLA